MSNRYRVIRLTAVADAVGLGPQEGLQESVAIVFTNPIDCAWFGATVFRAFPGYLCPTYPDDAVYIRCTTGRSRKPAPMMLSNMIQ